ncbi:MAG: DNA/RNA non-specific endonuclease [Marinifilaceae bacterium]|jgi:endonuclease G|nr:DNA/RNA non-specific endonuclease [Marinifilaceae bacterium]
MTYFKLILNLLFLIVATNLTAQYKPITENKNIISYNSYTISYLTKHKQSEWVYYKLTKNDLVKKCERKNKFSIDKNLNFNQANKIDYYKSGFDRGHLKPAADCVSNPKDMMESFYFTNMSPQKPGLNRGKWKMLEQKFRNLAIKYDSIYIVTGPILTENLKYIGDHVSIPKLFYKIAFLPKLNKMIAYLIPNKKIDDKLEMYKCTVDEIEELSHIDFFPQLEDNNEKKLESEIQEI